MTITNRNISKTTQQPVCTSVAFDKQLETSKGLLVTKQSSDVESVRGQVTEMMNVDKPEAQVEGRVDSFDHVTFWVGNAKQSAVFYMTQFGFEPLAFRGLETGFREHASHVVRLNDTIIQFVSACAPNNHELNAFLLSHGDAVKDVSFRVENIEDLLRHAIEQGAELVKPLEVEAFNPAGLAEVKQDNFPKYIVKRATIKTFGDVTHTFIERNYEYDQGLFLPGYSKPALEVSS